jgi:alkanesulfonate monooxygenase SsuD/methylene tetrahydromethanopterin reductase-like flavin-dependent oxidoreductase (luciferase family)
VIQVGLFFDLRNPPQWKRPWPDHYRQTLDRIVAAEEMGCDAVWFSEHHFLEDGYLPQPLTLAAAVAVRTTRVRIGTAIVLAALRPPVLVAEEVALVDILSGGRVELGIGAGYVPSEYEAYGKDIGKRMTLTAAATAEIRDLLDGDGVTPPPVQRPFPIWMGHHGPQAVRRAGRLGAGILGINAASLAPYQEGLAEGGHDPARARMGGIVELLLADDPEKATEQLLPFLAYQIDTRRLYPAVGTASSDPVPMTVERLRTELRTGGSLPGFAVLTPQDAVTHINDLIAGLPIHHVYLRASIAGMPDDMVDRHIELLLSHVRPALQG